MAVDEDPFSLERFLTAQSGGVYEQSLAELAAGRKRGHWIWFIFPQLRGLGSSENSRRYGISGIDEATAYLAHPVLGARLAACAAALLATGQADAGAALGEIDAIKLRSSMTLFERAGGGRGFGEVLERFFDGQRDPLTLALLGAEARGRG